ncbi:hypothetical protein EVAR_68869_1 [Eumeta japonica]|uniref:Uncharacterized protein n=1 Tax=Eumeta variegata TaxID=151549 RepID=A0A4C1ZB78_EUMVA|nr:hypothetical protein EVAR_68869_1 [Eumeta japonica]
MGLECPESDLEKFVRTATPVASHASTPASSANSSSTIVGSDSESESARSSVSDGAGRSSKSRTNSDASFSLVKGKNKKAIRKAIKKLNSLIRLRRPEGFSIYSIMRVASRVSQWRLHTEKVNPVNATGVKNTVTQPQTVTWIPTVSNVWSLTGPEIDPYARIGGKTLLFGPNLKKPFCTLHSSPGFGELLGSRDKEDNFCCQLPPRSRTLHQPVGEESAPKGRPGAAQGVHPTRAPYATSVAETAGPSSFGDDIQTVLAVLRAVKSSEFSDFARDIRACRNVEDKLLVVVRLHQYNDEIDSAIGTLNRHVRTVVGRCEREVPASSDYRKFPPDIPELKRAKNAALRRASAYPTPECRSRARALQSKVKACVQEF